MVLLARVSPGSVPADPRREILTGFLRTVRHRSLRVQLGLIFCHPALCGQGCGERTAECIAKGSLEGMKKIVLLGALLMSAAAAGHAQESRQDFSISGFGVLAPQVYGNEVVPMTTTITTGVLGSYRYLVTPRLGLEINYGFAQNSIKYYVPNQAHPSGEVHSKQQELSGALVYSRNYKNFNPFVEAGPGAILFTPILDVGTHQSGAASSTNVGGLFGGGVAYEISPSFDIRAEYRGFITKTPSFGISYFQTNRYYVISTPAIGIAYHF